MPWCPKCKTEYREGFKICADCGSELVLNEPADFPVEDQGGLENALPEGTSKERACFEETAGDPVDKIDEEGDRAQPRERRGGAGIYRDSSERASDNRSSAWVLLGLGVLGLIAVVLGAVGVIPLRLGNQYLFYGVMGAIFILFLVAGVVSMKNAKFFEKKAESENSLRQTLLEWCRDNLSAADIDVEVRIGGASEEIAYFKRFSYIKERLNHQFVNLSQGFLDQFIDDYIYDEIFGEKRE